MIFITRTNSVNLIFDIKFGPSKITIKKEKVGVQLFYQLIYNSLFNRLVRNFLKLIPGLPDPMKIHPSGLLKVGLKNGETIKLLTNQSCHVTKVLFWEGSSQYEYTDIFLSLFPKLKVFFDVGSNIGFFSIAASKTNPELKVFAFDPSPGPFRYLVDNVRINHSNNVFPQQLALSDSNGIFSFHFAFNSKYKYLKNNTLGGSGHLSHVRENPTQNRVDVKAQKLDDFVSENRISQLDLLKLDVEEAEHLVLAGAQNSIIKFRPIIVCEVFSTEILQQIYGRVMSIRYRAFIFENWMLKEGQISPQSTISKIENYFFVPEEKVGLFAQFIV